MFRSPLHVRSQKRMDTRRCASEDADPEWIVRSHIDWREERVSARTPDPEGRYAGVLWDLILIGEENEC